MQLVQATTQGASSPWSIRAQGKPPLRGLAAHFTDIHDLLEYAEFDRLKGLALHPQRIPGVELNGARMVGVRGPVPVGFRAIHKKQTAQNISAVRGVLSFPELVFMWRVRPNMVNNRLLVVCWQDPDHVSRYNRNERAYLMATIEKLHDGTTELYVDHDRPGNCHEPSGVYIPYWLRDRRT